MKAVNFRKAPAIKGDVWLAGPAQTKEKLRGKVCLVYFFSIGEPSSLTALPLLRYYSLRHKDELAIVGVHVPKYEHDREKTVVERALKGLEIDFPVVLDNEMKVWKSFANQFWGQVHIIDEKGLIRHTHAGSNIEEEVETDIFYLLKKIGSAEELRPLLGEFELEGNWYLGDDYAEHTSRKRDMLMLRYEGRSLAVAMRTKEKAVIEVRMDGKPVPPGSRGDDVKAEGKKTLMEVEGEMHLHVIKEDMDKMHDVSLSISTKGLQVTGFFS
jgi:hypothetical protein